MTNTKILLLLFAVLVITLSNDFNPKNNVTIKNFTSYAIQYSPDQTFLGAIDKVDHSFKIFDGRTLKDLQTVLLDAAVQPQCLSFSHDSKYFAIGDNNGYLYVYGRQGDIFNPVPIKTEQVTNNSAVLTVSFNNDNTKLAVGQQDGFISFFDITQLNQDSIFSQYKFIVKLGEINFGAPVRSIVYTPKSGNLLVGGSDSSAGPIMRLYNPQSLAINHTFTLDSNADSVLSVACSSDQSFYLNTGNYRNNDVKIQTWGNDFSKLTPLTQNIGTFNVMNKVLISDNSLYVASVGVSRAFIWQRTNVSNPLLFNKIVSSGLNNVALSPKEGKLLVAPSAGGVLSEYTLCDSDQFYQQATNLCSSCNSACLQCFGPLENQCYLCIKGKYISNHLCLKCVSGCLDCQNGNSCTQCNDPGHWQPTANGCKCKIGYYQQPIQICKACNTTVLYCTQCNGANQCTKCDATLNRDLDQDGKCTCIKGFFQNATTQLCDPCGISGCIKCNSPVQCTLCDQAQHWHENASSLCQCESRYVKVGEVCQHCDNPGCLKCQQTPDACYQCDKAKKWERNPLTNNCSCQKGTFFDKDISCLDCQNGCITCADKNDCNECYPDYSIKQGDCFCPKGKYTFNRTNCASCVLQGCQDCSSQTVCKTCFQGFELNQQKACVCKDNKTYPDGTKCSACVQPCLSCKDAGSCLSCIDGYTLSGEICEKDGLSALIIVIIVVGVLALAGVVFAIIKYCKKKKSKLQEQGEYEPIE